jgi:lysophospholipase L1-like esterase
VGPATYVALGDSWSDGTCAADKQTDNFVAVLARHLPTGAQYLNLGVPGIVLDRAIAIELPRALSAHPRFVTVWLADNDVGDGTMLAHYRDGLNRLLSDLRQAHIQTFVANEPDLRFVPSYRGQLPFIRRGLAYNRVIARSTADHGGVLVDVYPYTASLWGRADRVCRDGEHLNTRGYAALADIFYRVLHRSRAL